VIKTTDGALTNFGSDLAGLRREVAQLAESLRDLAKDRTRDAGLRLSDAVGSAGDKIADLGEMTHKRVQATNNAFEASIEENPLTATAIAFAAGILIGWISKSKD
jgi:ElaB/YqjD/DUF883 family membrane-anchored ribosome-binding protein